LEAPSRLDIWFGLCSNVANKRKGSDAKRNEEKKQRASCDNVARNVKLAELFQQLGKLHQKCPLLEDDPWKAYCNNLISGRLRSLDFEITDDPQILERVGQIKGIGDRSVKKMIEYFRIGGFQRIKEFQTDPKRVAMKRIMYIWGVGRVTVRYVNPILNSVLLYPRPSSRGFLCFGSGVQDGSWWI
jgi:hypothetical protein